MIKSITFKEGFGYISKKIDAPCKPDVSSREYRHFDNKTHREIYDKEKYQLDYKQYRKDLAYYKKHNDDYKNPQLAKNLLNRTFNFKIDKVNILFGPNGSGKTTIIKALAATALCQDGFFNFYTPMSIISAMDDAKIKSAVREKIHKSKKNNCDVEWDGVPVYYDNFSKIEKNYIEDWSGSVFHGIGEAITYLMDKKQLSDGQVEMYLLQNIVRQIKIPVTTKQLLKKYDRILVDKNCNDIWYNVYKTQSDYLYSFDKADSGEPNTLLFDEIDKSFDIMTTFNLFQSLADIHSKYGCQVIAVSHSPLILSKAINNCGKFNIISLDEEYTQQCKELIDKIF